MDRKSAFGRGKNGQNMTIANQSKTDMSALWKIIGAFSSIAIASGAITYLLLRRRYPQAQRVPDQQSSNSILPSGKSEHIASFGLCSHCRSQIRYVCYSCINCHGYHLCSACEPTSDICHNATHLFAKVKVPIPPWKWNKTPVLYEGKLFGSVPLK